MVCYGHPQFSMIEIMRHISVTRFARRHSWRLPSAKQLFWIGSIPILINKSKWSGAPKYAKGIYQTHTNCTVQRPLSKSRRTIKYISRWETTKTWRRDYEHCDPMGLKDIVKTITTSNNNNFGCTSTPMCVITVFSYNFPSFFEWDLNPRHLQF